MARQIINTADAPQPAVPISQAVRSGDFVFVSGITPLISTSNSSRMILKLRCVKR